MTLVQLRLRFIMCTNDDKMIQRKVDHIQLCYVCLPQLLQMILKIIVYCFTKELNEINFLPDNIIQLIS